MVIGLTWYTEDSWAEVKASATDPESFEASFAQWKAVAVAARRDEIIAVAIQCFQSRGFARTSISDLVAASGLSAGAIYGNFPGGKDEIFVAAATKILHTRRSELEARRTERTLSPGEVMATLIEGISSEQISHVLPQLWGEAAVDPDIRVLVQGVFLQLRRTVVDAIAAWAREKPEKVDGDPEAWAERAAPVILSTAPGFILQQALLPDFDAATYLAALPDVLPR